MSMTRRRLLSVAAATGTGMGFMVDETLQREGVVSAATTRFSMQAATPSTQSANLGQADAPAWSFALRLVEDPYSGKLSFPSEIPGDSRVVRAEVIIINASDQPLNFQTSSVHLLDAEGIEYAAGNAQGSEPRLVSQVLPDGERSRGSVWFVVPSAAELVEVRFYAPAPQLRVRLEVG